MSGINEDCEGVSDTFRQTLLIIRGTTAGLACLTCFIALLLMACFQLFYNTRKSTMCTQRLIIYLTLSALFHSICLSLQPMSYNYKDEEAENSVFLNVSCMATGFRLQYSSWVELLFTLVITVHLVLLPFKKEYKIKWKELGYVLFPLILPLVFSWIPFLQKNYGMYGAWCWIQKDDLKCNIFLEGMIEQFALWHGPRFILLSISLLLLAVFFCHLHRLHQESEREAMLLQIIPLVIYSIVFQVLSWFGFVNDIYRAATQKE